MRAGQADGLASLPHRGQASRQRGNLRLLSALSQGQTFTDINLCVHVAFIPTDEGCLAQGHSYGEYVFDHSWAALGSRLGQRYCELPALNAYLMHCMMQPIQS